MFVVTCEDVSGRACGRGLDVIFGGRQVKWYENEYTGGLEQRSSMVLQFHIKEMRTFNRKPQKTESLVCHVSSLILVFDADYWRLLGTTTTTAYFGPVNIYVTLYLRASRLNDRATKFT